MHAKVSKVLAFGKGSEVSSDGGVGGKFSEGSSVPFPEVIERDPARRDSISRRSVLGNFILRGVGRNFLETEAENIHSHLLY